MAHIGLYRVYIGRENGSCYNMLGLYRDIVPDK